MLVLKNPKKLYYKIQKKKIVSKFLKIVLKILVLKVQTIYVKKISAKTLNKF